MKFSLQTRDPATAKERTSLATAHLERLYVAIRQGPRPLTNKEAVALAGLVYEAFATSVEDEPGPASVWAAIVRANEAAAAGADPVASLVIGGNRDHRRASMERRFGAIADAILAGQCRPEPRRPRRETPAAATGSSARP